MNKLKKILMDWFTEVDNKTFDITKMLAAVSIITAIFLAVYSVMWLGNEFNYQDYGLGTAALFAGVGVAMGLKKDSDCDK